MWQEVKMQHSSLHVHNSASTLVNGQEWQDWENSIWIKYAARAPQKPFASELAAELKWLLQQVCAHASKCHGEFVPLIAIKLLRSGIDTTFEDRWWCT